MTEPQKGAGLVVSRGLLDAATANRAGCKRERDQFVIVWDDESSGGAADADYESALRRLGYWCGAGFLEQNESAQILQRKFAGAVFFLDEVLDHTTSSLRNLVRTEKIPG